MRRPRSPPDRKSHQRLRQFQRAAGEGAGSVASPVVALVGTLVPSPGIPTGTFVPVPQRTADVRFSAAPGLTAKLRPTGKKDG